MLHRIKVVIALCLVGMVNAGCWHDKFFYQSVAYVDTFIKEQDDLLGIHTFVDPNRAYYGARTTNVERYGITSTYGTTNSSGQSTKSNLSVPNKWNFSNQDGACSGRTTYNERLVHGGVADLKCEVYTGYNGSEYTVRTLSGDTVDGDNDFVPEPTNLNRYLLTANLQVRRHEVMKSGGGMYYLTLLDDGDLVFMYNGNDTRWSSNTSGSGATRLLMQGDGNLVLYTAGGSAVWSTGTPGNPGAYLNVQDDGNLVLYSSSDQPLWTRD